MKAEFPGVQHESGDGDDLALGIAINGIAKDGVAHALAHVDSDLMGAPGEELAANEGAALMGANLLPFGDGFFAGAVQEVGHAFAIHGVATKHGLDATFGFLWQAVDGGEVDFTESALGKGFTQAPMGDVVFSDDHAAGGVFIEPMDDAGSHLTADAAKVVTMMEEGIDEGAVWVPGCGVDDQSGRFIEHEDVFVLKEDLQRDVLGNDGDGRDLWNGDGKGISCAHGGAGFGGAAIERDVSVPEKVLNPSPREVGQAPGEVLVEPLPGFLLFSDGPIHDT